MGYPKIWTSIMEEDWWKKWRGLTRGCFLQLLLLMKNGDDSGYYVAHSYTNLSIVWGIDRRTAREVCTKMSQDSGLRVYKNAQGQLVLFHPKYLFYQELDAADHAKYIRSRVHNSPKNALPPDQTILEPDQTIEEAPVFSKPKEEEPKDHKLYALWMDWKDENQIAIQALVLNSPDIPAGVNKVEWVRSVIGDLERALHEKPEKFQGTNFMATLKAWLREQRAIGKPGNYGMVGMSYEKEKSRDDEKRADRKQTSSFDDGSGIKL